MYDRTAQEHTTSLQVTAHPLMWECDPTLVDKVSELFTAAGYHIVDNKYIHKETTNIKEGICVPRVFLQGKFTKSFATGDNKL